MTINNKTSQQETRQDKTRLKRKLNKTIAMQHNKRRQKDKTKRK